MNPAAGEAGFVVRLTAPLPAPDALPAAQDNWGWLIELPDGTTCFPFTGANPLIQGQVAHYGCGRNESVFLLGDLVSNGKVWTARRAVVATSGDKPVVKSSGLVTLKRVWQ